MGKVSWIKQAIFAAILLLLAAGCKKEITPGDIEYPITHWPAVQALGVTTLTPTTAILNGTINGYGLLTTVTFEYGTTTNYGSTVTASQSPVSGNSITNVSVAISGLTPNTTYHFRVRAENSMWINFYSRDMVFTILTDVDGNAYSTITIGSQNWMAENLKTTRYRNGDLIGTTNPATLNISAQNTPKYQWANGGKESDVTTYGRLYTWYAATDLRNVCPTGWHLPADGEWTTLTTLLGGVSVAGGSLKGESGFAALPGGWRFIDGSFNDVGSIGQWWSSTPYDNDNARYRYVSLALGVGVGIGFQGAKRYGFSVRCLKDNDNPSIPILTTTAGTATSLNTATSGGYITSDGGASIISCGVCWNSSGNPTIANSKTINDPGNGSFTCNITGLSGDSIYYLRAYAINSVGTGYGDDIIVFIGQAPTVTTENATSITITGATLNGTVNANLPTIVAFEYGTTTSYGNTVTANPGTVTGAISTTVSADITGLTAGTTYHYRIKAENSRGTVYGDDKEFKLPQCTTVTTLPPTNISATGVTLNGIVNAHGLATTVTFRIPEGRGYRTVTAAQSPVTGDHDILVTADISGLVPGTTHSFRVIATNSCGTFYGGSIKFTLLPPCSQIPTVTTLSATNISATGATLNGTVNANGTQTTVTFECTMFRGTKTVPAIQSPIAGDTDVLVTADISGLAPGTTHAFKVKATNSCGTVYGNSIYFATSR
jgi:uncharacterized protein (TIGR02145 family)